MKSRLALVVITLAVFLAGCSGSAVDGERGDKSNGERPAPLPPRCDLDRPAVAHHPDGVAIAHPRGPVPFPCFMRVGHRSLEPTMGITSSGVVFFYPASDATLGNVGSDPVSGAVSRDGGATWELVTPAHGGEATHPWSLDPYMYLDPATDRVFFDDLFTVNCSILSWSDDDGANWDHSAAGCMATDHQTVFAGPPAISTTVGYPNVVYRCAVNAVAGPASAASSCQGSLDGGRTWLPPGAPVYTTETDEAPETCDGGLGHGIVDSTGRVWVPKGLCAQPWIAWSDDEGLTWTRVQVADTGMSRDAGGFASHEAAVGVDPGGNVYYLWVAEDRSPYLSVSRDRGGTWSEPMMVGAPGVNEASMPALMVGGKGKVAFAYLGTTNGPGRPFPQEGCSDQVMCSNIIPSDEYDNTTWNGYLSVSYDVLADEPIFYSAAVNDPEAPLIVGSCGSQRCQEVFDFIDVVIAPDGSPWAPYVDGCSSEMTTCEPHDGELGEGVVGRLWGGASLWDDEDPNGPYP